MYFFHDISSFWAAGQDILSSSDCCCLSPMKADPPALKSTSPGSQGVVCVCVCAKVVAHCWKGEGGFEFYLRVNFGRFSAKSKFILVFRSMFTPPSRWTFSSSSMQNNVNLTAAISLCNCFPARVQCWIESTLRMTRTLFLEMKHNLSRNSLATTKTTCKIFSIRSPFAKS